MKRILLVIQFVLMMISGFCQESIVLTIDTSKAEQTDVTTIPGGWDLTATGKSPYILFDPIKKTFDPDTLYVIEFEYFTVEETEFKVYFSPLKSKNSTSAEVIPASESWAKHIINLKARSTTWTSSVFNTLRMDYANKVGQNMKIRNVKLRTITSKEYSDWNLGEAQKLQLNNKLVDYQKKIYNSKIENVVVNQDKITISGTQDLSSGPLFLGEVKMNEYVFDISNFCYSQPLPAGNSKFTITLDRFVTKSGSEKYDRLYSRWVVAKKSTEANFTLMSRAHWAEDITDISINKYQEFRATSKKGISGALNTQEQNDDLKILGVTNITVNVILSSIISTKSTDFTDVFNGKTYFFNKSRINDLDKQLKNYSDRNIKVSVILLIPPGLNGDMKRIFIHPNADGGNFVMSNMLTEEGVEYFTAAIDFMAKRYGDPKMQYGHISNWIILNEIDAAKVWTNAGDLSQEMFIEQYMRTMRAVYYTVRKYNPSGKVFISSTKHWKSVHTYCTPEMYKTLSETVGVEGDFEFGYAFHSYPIGFLPRIWDETAPDVTDDITTTNNITPKNLDLIDFFARSNENLYEGVKVRSIILSENGMWTKDPNDPQTLADQAAGVAYFWKKANTLPAIETLHYHLWKDKTGKNFGLWPVNPDPVKGNQKPAYFIYKAAGTSNEEKIFSTVMPTIGITDWNSIFLKLKPDVELDSVQFIVKEKDKNVPGIKVAYIGEAIWTDVNGQATFYRMASGRTVNFRIYKPDGSIIEKKVTIDNNKVTVFLD